MSTAPNITPQDDPKHQDCEPKQQACEHGLDPKWDEWGKSQGPLVDQIAAILPHPGLEQLKLEDVYLDLIIDCDFGDAERFVVLKAHHAIRKQGRNPAFFESLKDLAEFMCKKPDEPMDTGNLRALLNALGPDTYKVRTNVIGEDGKIRKTKLKDETPRRGKRVLVWKEDKEADAWSLEMAHWCYWLVKWNADPEKTKRIIERGMRCAALRPHPALLDVPCTPHPLPPAKPTEPKAQAAQEKLCQTQFPVDDQTFPGEGESARHNSESKDVAPAEGSATANCVRHKPRAIAVQDQSHKALKAIREDREIKAALLELGPPWTKEQMSKLLSLAQGIGGGSFFDKGRDFRPFWVNRIRADPGRCQMTLARALSERMEGRLTGSALGFASHVIDDRESS